MNAQDENRKRGINMRINVHKLELALAKSCMKYSDLRSHGQVSSATLAKIRNDANYDVRTDIVGKIAKAIGIPVEDLIFEEVV